MLADLTGSGPILEVLNVYRRRCRGLAEAEGVDARDPDALRRWVLARLEVEDDRSPEGVVTRAVNALVMRDANWHAIDFEHEPLGRYVWDLVAELARPGPDGAIPGVSAPVAWYAVVERFECAGAEYEVRVPGEGGGETPHLRVSRLHDLPLPDVCVVLHRPWYLPDGLHRWQLDGLHRHALIAFLVITTTCPTRRARPVREVLEDREATGEGLGIFMREIRRYLLGVCRSDFDRWWFSGDVR